MRRFLVSLAAAGAALVAAAPAVAQWGPQPVYAPRAYGYGYNNVAIAQGLEARVAGIRAQVRDLGARGLIRWNKARNLDREAFNLQRQIHASAWHGLSPGESYSLDNRIRRLEYRVQTAALRGRHAPRYAGYRYAGYRW
jgi:hypothetical protein